MRLLIVENRYEYRLSEIFTFFSLSSKKKNDEGTKVKVSMCSRTSAYRRSVR